MKMKSLFIITFICFLVDASAFSFLEIHFSIKNLTESNLILEYELYNEFNFLGRKTVNFFDNNNEIIAANSFKINPSQKYKLYPNKIKGNCSYKKDSNTENIPFISRFNQVFKEFKITDEVGNVVLMKEDITNDSFKRDERRAIYYFLEIPIITE
ncbi:MAG: hypothetical protein KA785_04015 [Spirochaetaceae bacterium]|nr:hypothetical protein [Spirochaetaceae bacterium]